MSIFIIEHVKEILCECFFPLSNLETGVVQFYKEKMGFYTVYSLSAFCSGDLAKVHN